MFPENLFFAAGLSTVVACFIFGNKRVPESEKKLSLSDDGLCVIKQACDAKITQNCYEEVMRGLSSMFELPGSDSTRYFQAISITPLSKRPFTHRSEWMLPLSPTVLAVLKSVLSGEAGAALLQEMGPEADLLEMTMITSLEGAHLQYVHSDGSPNAPRVITMFMALHDIVDEAMGPTRFWPGTHKNSTPPTAENVDHSQSKWFRLNEGDAILMDHLTYHCGGANNQPKMRTLFSASFMQSEKSSGDHALRLGDFYNKL